MDRDVYQRMEQLETSHWWFLARRQIIEETIRRLVRPRDGACILEAGCGSGGNLEILKTFGDVHAFEYDEDARRVATMRAGVDIPFGALPDDLPFDGTQFDLIGLFDVLEHIEHDVECLVALRGKLADGGAIFLTVPAFQFLWSKHDERHHHFRRYSKASLKRAAARAGLVVDRSFYFNSFLFPAATAARALKSIIGNDAPDDAMPAHLINSVLYRLFRAERHLLGRIPMPFGLSLGAILKE